MDHNLEGGAVEIVVNPNLSSGVIGNRLEGSLNLDRNIVVTADDDGRLTASTIQPEGSAFCLVCDNLIKDRRNVDVRHLFIADSVTLHTQQQVGTLLAHVLNVNHLDHEEVYSDVLCRRCGRLLDELDEVEQRSIVIRNKIQDWYNKSVLRRLKNPNDPSIEAYDDLDLSEDEAVTSVIKVKSAPVESDLDDDPLLDELRPEDQGIRADDPEFNPFYDVQRRQRGRGRGRGGRSRGRGRGRGRGRVGRPPKYGFTKYPPVSSTGSTVSAGEKFGQLVTKILGDEETSPMDTDIETEKGEVATNTDQQTEKTAQLGRAREPGKRVPVLSEKMRENLALHLRKSQPTADSEFTSNDSLLTIEKSFEGEEIRPKRSYRKRPHVIHLCKFCMKVCPTGEQLKEHQKTHESIECSFCGKILARIGAWETHLKVFHNVEIQLPGSEASLSRPKEELACPECGKIFVSRPALSYHLRLHDGKSYPCDICGKVFNHPSNLKTHRLRHEKKTFYCDKCGKGFHTNFALLMHDNQTHRLAKSWKCRFCGKAFTRCAAYREHIRVHTGEKPYECNVCGVKFRKVHHLKTHAKQHEPKTFRGGPFKCQLCPNTIFLHKISYDRHRKFKHPDLDVNTLISCNENIFSNDGVLKESLMISSSGEVGMPTLIGSDEYRVMTDFQEVEGIEMVEGDAGVAVGPQGGQCIIYLTETADVKSEENQSFIHRIEIGQHQKVSQVIADDAKPLIKTELLVNEENTEGDLQLELNDPESHQVVREFDDEQLEALQQMNDSALQQLSSGQLQQLSMSSLSGGNLQVQMPDGETFDVYTIAQ